MLPPEWQRFVTLRDDLLAAIRAHLQRNGHCKPYEGAFTLELPNVFNSECVIKLSCYVIGPHRHYTWTGPTFAAALDQCERDVRLWLGDVRFLMAELDAARAREQALKAEADTFHMQYRMTCDVESKAALVRAEQAEAREAKLREALTKTTANLRHAFANLYSTSMSADDTRRFADGLIAPEIRRLEAALAEGEDTRG